jgi:hypothetical protein
MKFSRLLLAAFALCVAATSQAATAVVTTVATTSAVTILNPTPGTTLITIQNASTSTGQVNLTFDGGSAYTNPFSGKTGSDPTTTITGKGYWLAVGQQITINVPASDTPGHLPVRAIMATGTAIISITINDQISAAQQTLVFPTS